ncbi:MAG: peptide chain release factor-like protein [Lentisphaeria bacterium]|jgi:hypothetical protein
MGTMAEPRDALLQLPAAELLRHCRVDHRRGSGPGGQSRNTTESAVTVTHPASGLHGYADDTRSQIRNRELALRRLRRELALGWRQPPPACWDAPAEPPSPHAESYPLWLARLLDVLAGHGWRLAEAAAFCGVSTGRLVRLLARDPALWQALNRERARAGLPLLRRP